MTESQTDTHPARAGWTSRISSNLVLTALSAIASYWSVKGYEGVAADWLGVAGWDAYLLFGMFEGVIIALILIASRTRLNGDSAAAMWCGAWLLTGLACGVQAVHSLGTTLPWAALVYGSATLVVILLWQLKIRLKNREELRKLGLIAAPGVKLGLGLWVRFPRWAWRAQTVARWENIDSPAIAMRRAQQLYPIGDMPWDKAHARRAAQLSKTASKGRATPASETASETASKSEPVSASKPPSHTAPVNASQVRSNTASKTTVRVASATPVRATGEGPASTALLTKARTFAIAHREKKGRLPGIGPIREHLHISQNAAKELRDQVHAELSNDTDQYAAQ